MSTSIRVSIRTPESSVFNTIPDIDCLVSAAIVEEKAAHIGRNGRLELVLLILDRSHIHARPSGTAKVNASSIRKPVMYSRLTPGSFIVHRDRAKRISYRFNELGMIDIAVFKDIHAFI